MVTKTRLDLIIKELGLSGRAFEKECGLANGSYSSIRDGVGADKLNKILVRYPQISADWLLTGRGDMLKAKDSHTTNEYLTPNTNTNMKTILLQIADLISGQQHDISRLISEIERNGQRSDRVLSLLEHHYKTTDSSGSKKKSGIN